MSTLRTPVARAAAALVAAGAAHVAWRALRARPPVGRSLWERKNHRGDVVTLLEGPAFAAGAVTAAALTPGIPARLRGAAVVATAGAAVFGAVDDLAESAVRKGLRGHLGALARGELTTGGLKVLGISASGLAAASLAVPVRTGGRSARTADVLLAGALVAGAANLANLFDLRPGRALKVVLLHTPAVLAPGPAGALVAIAGGAAVRLLPEDLGERGMLGDTGANAAGALLGTAAVAGLPPRGRVAVLTVVAALTLASERVSFTKVIEATPGLREFDALGRRPR